MAVERTPKAYLEELDEAIGQDRRELGKKPFDKKDDDEITRRPGRSAKVDSCIGKASRTASITANTDVALQYILDSEEKKDET